MSSSAGLMRCRVSAVALTRRNLSMKAQTIGQFVLVKRKIVGAWGALRRRRGAGRRGGLTRRLVVASCVLCLLVIGTSTVLFLAINRLGSTARTSDTSEAVLTYASRLKENVVEVETGQRGFLITHEDKFLEPWRSARAAFPRNAVVLERLAAKDDPRQRRAAQDLVGAMRAYIDDFSVPQVEAARRDPTAVRDVAVAEEGKIRLDAVRARFHRFVDAQRRIATARRGDAMAAARRATVAAAIGAASSVALICLFAAYLARTIVRPVRGAARMAGRLERGDLAVRMPERSPGEIQLLERSFNTLAGSLQVSRARLHRLVEELAALHRIATLVARGVPPPEVFAAVTEEVGRLIGTNAARLLRYETDDTVTVVDSRNETGTDIPSGTRLSIEGHNVPALVWRTSKPARVDSFADAPGPLAALFRRQSVKGAAGAPIVVDGRHWGVLSAFTTTDEPLPADAESRMSDFTDLVATAITNAQNRAELIASRARVVATSDATRRRIERDLHDGAQQRLVSLGLELRAAEAAVPAGYDALGRQLADTVEGLGSVLADLREISHGLHPAILAKGGLGAALKSLARSAAVPVELNVHADRRLAEPVEVAIYYAVSESLANTLKHANATSVRVDLDLDVEGDVVRLSVHDDGVGGADLNRGTGLIGLKDRVASLGGRLDVVSPAGEGTSLLIRIPLEDVPPGNGVSAEGV
jgi:signal transduction histidine kinase